MSKFVFFSLFLFSMVSRADEIKVHATVGERIMHYHAAQVKGDYVLTLQVNEGQKKQVKLGKDNFITLRKKMDGLLAMKPEKEECDRDSSSAEYKSDSGKARSFEVCYLSNSSRGKAYRALVNLLSVAVN